MWVYSTLFLVPLAWAIRGMSPKGGQPGKWLIAASAICLSLFIGLRFRVGGDWHSYWLMLERAHNFDFAAAMTVSDPAYMAVNIVAARLGLSIGFVNLVCAALVVWGTNALALRQRRPWLALLVAVPVLLAVTAMTTTRQSAAVGLELIAIAWFLGGRRRLPAAALLLACAFHWSAIALLGLIPLLVSRPERRARIGWSLIALAAAAAAVLWFAAAPGFPAAGALFRLLPSLIAASAVPLLRRRLLLTGLELPIACYLAGLALLCLAQLPVSSLNADRLGLYTIALQMLVLARLPDIFEPRSGRLAAAAILTGFYVGLFAVWASFTPYAVCMTPYRSYLQEPHRLVEREWPAPVC